MHIAEELQHPDEPLGIGIVGRIFVNGPQKRHCVFFHNGQFVGHDEIVNVALDASKQVLGREVNSEDNAKLVSTFADDVKKEGKNA